MTMRRLALQASLALDHKRRWKRALHHAAKHYKAGFGDVEQMQPRKKPTNAFCLPGVAISNTLATVWIAHRGSVIKCARSQVRPFRDDDEAAHEHVTEHMRDLGERLLFEGDFPYEDITGQGEPPVDSPHAESRRRMRRKTRPISLEQSTVSPVNASSDATRQEAERDHDDKRRRVDEPESTVTTAAQDEVSTLSPVPFDSKTRNDEVAVDVPLPEETAEMSGESGQGWITEEAFFTVSLGARQVRQRKEVKMNLLLAAEKREFLKSMDTEWRTLFKNQAAKVLSLEETVQARAR